MANSDLSKDALFPIPRIPEEIVAYLDRTFPERCPVLGETMEAIMHQSGQRSVVRYLIRIFEDQNDNKLLS